MPRRKIPIALIDNQRARAVTFAKRKEGFKKKAKELATLCDVPVAVVCAGPDSRGVPDFWPSPTGAAELFWRYHGLPQEQRTRHTHDHAGYVAAELGKESAKLARLREGGIADALPPWDCALDDLPPDALRELLFSIDASLSAARDRMQRLQSPDQGHAFADVDIDDAALQLGLMSNAEPDIAAALGYAAPDNTASGVIDWDLDLTELDSYDFLRYDCGQWPLLELPCYEPVLPTRDVQLQIWPWALDLE